MGRLACLALPCALVAQEAPANQATELSKARDWPGLEAWAHSQIKGNPNESKNHLFLGKALGEQGRLPEAILAFRRAAELDPTKVEAWFNLCLAGAKNSDRAVATEGLDAVAVRNFRATRNLVEMGEVKAVLGSELPAAQEDFSRIKIKHQPPAPPYPAEAKAKKIQGTVIVEITQDRDGRVIKVRSLQGPEVLQETAANYATCWRFAPIPADRKDDRLCFRITMPFRVR